MACPALTVYRRFEQLVALVLAVLVSFLVTFALRHLTWRIVLLVIYGLADPALNGRPAVFLGLAGSTLALGAACRLVREQDFAENNDGEREG